MKPVAIYTSSGMQIRGYVQKRMGQIFYSRSLFNPVTRARDPVTAYVLKDPMGGRRLLSYNCSRSWLQAQFPDITLLTMEKNNKFPLEDNYELNPDVVPNDVQQSAVSAVLTNNFKTAFFNIPTGIGKTLLSVYLMSLLKCKGWAMCYRTSVLAQWKHTLAEKTDFNIDRVKIVNTSADLLKMANGDWDPTKYDIYLSTPMILIKFAEKYGLDLLNDALDTCGIGVKFFDEAHKNVGNITKINALTNIERTYYLSADFGQPQPERQNLYYKMFAHIPVIRPSEEKIDELKYMVGCLVRYNTHPSIPDKDSVFVKHGFSHFEFMDYQLGREQFYDALDKVIDQVNMRSPHTGNRYRTLVLCNMIKHTEILKQHIEDYIAVQQWSDPPVIGMYHSQIDAEVKQNVKDHAEIIVSTYQSMGVGVDMKNIRFILSLAPVNIIDDNQAAGRARPPEHGEDCFYFMFIDDGFEIVTNKLPDRLAYLHRQKLKQIVSIKYS